MTVLYLQSNVLRRLPSAFVPLFGLTGGNLANALSQLSGEAATGAQRVGFQLTTQVLGLMLDPFVDGRSGIGGGGGHPARWFAPAGGPPPARGTPPHAPRSHRDSVAAFLCVCIADAL